MYDKFDWSKLKLRPFISYFKLFEIYFEFKKWWFLDTDINSNSGDFIFFTKTWNRVAVILNQMYRSWLKLKLLAEVCLKHLPKFSNAHNSCGFSNPSKNGIRVIYHVLIFKVYDWFPVNDQATITWFSQQEQWGGVLHWVPLSETY